MSDNEKKALIEALEKICCAVSWTVPNSAPSVESYLKDAWAAIDKLKDDCNKWGERETINKTGDFVTHITRLFDSGGDMVAMYCGCGCLLESDDNYCPNCGAKVVDE